MSAQHITTDWLAPEPLIVGRLKAEVPQLRGVFTAADLQAVEEDQDPQAAATPAAHVFYLGDRIPTAAGASAGQGEAQIVEQLWALALVIRNYRDAAAARKEAGALIPKLIDAMAGWDCGLVGLRPFRRAPLPSAPKFYANGKAIFPLIFSARVIA